MRRLSERTLWYLTGFTLAALLLIAAAGARVTSNYAESVNWVLHTHQVATSIDQIRASLFAAQNGRFQYVFGGQSEGLVQFRAAEQSLPAQIAHLRQLIADNPDQHSYLASLTPLIEQQLNVLRISTEMKLQGGSTELQDQYSDTVHDLFAKASADLDSLWLQENKLLGLRKLISDKTYRTEKIVLSICFAIVLLFTVLNFIELLIQLRNRQNAEVVVRRLGGRILQVQDEERRKLARDLHDGIGQLFAALKMTLSQAMRNPSDAARISQTLAEAIRLVDEGITQSRTMSYLLHPPMLDEVGFSAAARWLVDGFSERSKIAVSLDMPEGLHLPSELELTLFRVLQEGLTNIHRHSGSKKAEVAVSVWPQSVVMTLRDFGKGIPEEIMGNFRNGKAPTGVGLGGMRGRVADIDGKLELESSSRGTLVRVRIPLPAANPAAGVSSNPATHAAAKGFSPRPEDSVTPPDVPLHSDHKIA